MLTVRWPLINWMKRKGLCSGDISANLRVFESARRSLTSRCRTTEKVIALRWAMNFSDSLTSAFHPQNTPPLRQSRQSDMALESLYVFRHVRDEPAAESEAAARGVQIHRILATYIDHLVQ